MILPVQSVAKRYTAVLVRGCDHMCRAVSSRVLVPGDVKVILPGTATCDTILLQGNCLVEEANLTGEVSPSTVLWDSLVAQPCVVAGFHALMAVL